MKKANNPNNERPRVNELISELYTICSQANLNLTKNNTKMELPMVEEIENPLDIFDSDENRKKKFVPTIDMLTIEAYGLYVPMDNIKLHRPLIILFRGNIEVCARHYLKKKYGISEDHPMFTLLYKRTTDEMQTLAMVYFTSLWILEHAKVRGGNCYGIPADLNPKELQFKKTLALWMTSLVANKHEGLSDLLKDMIATNEDYQAFYECLKVDRSVTFQSLTQCIRWNTYSTELMIALCKECCGESYSTLRVNPHRFWWKLSLFVYDKHVSPYSSNEIKRIVLQHYPKDIHRLPFLFDGSALQFWN